MVNDLPPIARWMREQARILFEAEQFSSISLDLTTHIPELDSRPMALEFFLDSARVCALTLISYGWLELRIDVREAMATVGHGRKKFEFEIRADRTWQPSKSNDGSHDDRQLSIAVCNLQINI